MSQLHPVGPPSVAYGLLIAAAGAIILAAFFVIHGRIFVPGGVIERKDRPGLYWTAVLGAGLAALLLLALAVQRV